MAVQEKGAPFLFRERLAYAPLVVVCATRI